MKTKQIKSIACLLVKTLQKAGYTALFAGGWVRDYLLKKESDDIDIATNAHPEEVLKIFPHAHAVGAQFGVVRVRLKGHEFEVATFRSDEQYIDGRRPTNISLHSSPEMDAQRRDFTINGMFYDPFQHKIFDFVGGKEDLEKKVLKTIGSPYERFKEDRLRIIRAIRFKNVFRLSADKNTWKAICDEGEHVIASVSPERIWQELDKMLKKKVLYESLQDMKKCGLLFFLFPHLRELSENDLETAFEAIKRYKKHSLSGVICFFTPVDLRKKVAEKFHLSSKEGAVISAFTKLEKAFLTRPKNDTLARLYALPEANTALEVLAATKKTPQAFLNRHKEKQKKLIFWIKQVKTRKFLLGGEEFKELLIPPGKRLGELIEKAFSLSCCLNIRKKEKVIALLQKMKLV